MQILSVNRVIGKIRQSIVHPAHIPFIVESQASVRNGLSDIRKSRRLFRNRYHARVIFMHDLVQF